MRPALLALVAATTVAQAAPPAGAPPGASGDELVLIARARLADRAGDLEEAARQWRKAMELEPRASTKWQLADLERRGGEYAQAIRSFEEYKKLAATDAARADADAVIAAIRATPHRVSIGGLDAEVTHVFIDGVRAGTTPLERELPEGRHFIDLVGATHFVHASHQATLMSSDWIDQRDTSYGAKPGNVVLGGSLTLSTIWRVPPHELSYPGRFTLPAGRFTFELPENYRACKPITIDVPRSGLLFVYLEATKETGSCTRITVVQHKVPL